MQTEHVRKDNLTDIKPQKIYKSKQVQKTTNNLYRCYLTKFPSQSTHKTDAKYIQNQNHPKAISKTFHNNFYKSNKTQISHSIIDELPCIQKLQKKTKEPRIRASFSLKKPLKGSKHKVFDLYVSLFQDQQNEKQYNKKQLKKPRAKRTKVISQNQKSTPSNLKKIKQQTYEQQVLKKRLKINSDLKGRIKTEPDEQTPIDSVYKPLLSSIKKSKFQENKGDGTKQKQFRFHVPHKRQLSQLYVPSFQKQARSNVIKNLLKKLEKQKKKLKSNQNFQNEDSLGFEVQQQRVDHPDTQIIESEKKQRQKNRNFYAGKIIKQAVDVNFDYKSKQQNQQQKYQCPDELEAMQLTHQNTIQVHDNEFRKEIVVIDDTENHTDVKQILNAVQLPERKQPNSIPKLSRIVSVKDEKDGLVRSGKQSRQHEYVFHEQKQTSKRKVSINRQLKTPQNPLYAKEGCLIY